MAKRNTQNDPCLHIRHEKGKTTYIGTWVDDTLIVTDDEGIEQFKLDYKKAGYDISYFGDVDKFLGIACKYDRKLGTLTLDQKEYIDEILHNFNMKDSKGVNSPMIHKPNRSDCPEQKFKALTIKNNTGELLTAQIEQAKNDILEEYSK